MATVSGKERKQIKRIRKAAAISTVINVCGKMQQRKNCLFWCSFLNNVHMLVTGRRVGGASDHLHYNCDVVTFMRGFIE